VTLPGTACRTPLARKPDIVLVLVDTLRRDHLGIYGYGRDNSPNLDALAATGRIFDNHVATASPTVPSTLSMLLGLYPVEHGFPHRSIGQFAAARPHYPDELHFLAEELRDAGFRTAAFVEPVPATGDRKDAPETGADGWSEEDAERLRALGYLN
jgi:arylsulfatase A-like enzyme